MASLFLAGFPQAARAVVITVNTVITAGDTSLDGQAIEVRGAQLTVSGPHTFAELAVTNGGVVTHPAAEATGLSLTITGNCSVDGASRIDVSGRGFPANQGPGAAPAASFGEAGGGGYGGTGGSGSRNGPGYTYGSIFQPTELGSGGGSNGGAGGGAVRLVVQGTLTVDGSILANGNNGADGGGSGGSIWITTSDWTGNGPVRAHGGNGG
ncbi:MAG: hypothetical protein HY718_03735, partial [Planctomycetes bacterium]|nr:hypothetical protein [Planctomycetota bacterium]